MQLRLLRPISLLDQIKTCLNLPMRQATPQFASYCELPFSVLKGYNAFDRNRFAVLSQTQPKIYFAFPSARLHSTHSLRMTLHHVLGVFADLKRSTYSPCFTHS
jgi:hypothetical protein